MPTKKQRKKPKETPIGLVVRDQAYVQGRKSKFERVRDFISNNPLKIKFLTALAKGRVYILGKDGKMRKIDN